MDKHGGEVSPSDFDLAAQACGHNTATGIGAQNARADYRVWDLLREIDSVVASSTAHTRAYRAAEASS